MEIWHNRSPAAIHHVQWLKSAVPQNTSQPPPLCTWAYGSLHGAPAGNLVPGPVLVYSGTLAHTALHRPNLASVLNDAICSPPSSAVSTVTHFLPGAKSRQCVLVTARHGGPRPKLGIYGQEQRIWPAMKRTPSLTYTFPHGGFPTL